MVEAKEHIGWCIWHEGVAVFEPYSVAQSVPEDLRPIHDIRSEMMSLQAHNTQAMRLITATNDDGLKSLILECCAEIPGQYNLREHFRWVCYHEGWMPEFRVWSASNNFQGIRGKYHEKQEHNPNARSLLACLRDSEIRSLVDSL